MTPTPLDAPDDVLAMVEDLHDIAHRVREPSVEPTLQEAETIDKAADRLAAFARSRDAGVQEAVLAERERCARVAETHARSAFPRLSRRGGACLG